MPLFGKKKNDGKKPYPTQQPAYPTQGQYPAQPAYNPQVTAAYQQQAYAAPPPQGAGYPGAPPPYSATAAPVPQAAAGYPQVQQVYVPPQQQPQTVVVHGGFDAGARFDGRNPPTIPPPPPGCMPNAAQMASAQGQNVVVSQKPSNWMTGGSDGGYTVW